MKYSGLILSVILLLANIIAFAQDTLAPAEYIFTKKIELKHTPVKDQSRSGTCWSYAAVSFLESELLRMGKESHDLSEMFFVNHAYRAKADKYVRMHGSSNFGPGGQAHDVMNVLKTNGIATQQAYPGLYEGEEKHNHGELDAVLEGFLKAVVSKKGGTLTPVWPTAYGAILDSYLGELPENTQQLVTKDKPALYSNTLGINPDDYVELTSYTHHPFYSSFVLEIPDNWSGGLYYNVPLDELVEVMHYSLEKGYTVCWDGDVSDKGFSHANGFAIVPAMQPVSTEGTEMSKWETMSEKERSEQIYNFKEPRVEKVVTPQMRQKAFDNFQATDDHLMHLVGVVQDQNGKKYFTTKNSWAEKSNKEGGFLKMSESFVRMNTIAILVHKNAIPAHIRKKAGI